MSKLLEDLDSLRELLVYDEASGIDGIPGDELPEDLSAIAPPPEASDEAIPLLDEAIPVLDEAIPVLDDVAFVEPPQPAAMPRPAFDTEEMAGEAAEAFAGQANEQEGWPAQQELDQLVEGLLAAQLPGLKAQLREQLIEELRLRYPSLPWE